MFGSLPVVGGGLELAIYDLYWAGFEGGIELGRNWSFFVGGSYLISAQSGNEFSNPQDFEAAKFQGGVTLDSSWIWKQSRFKGEISSLDFVNQFGFGTEGNRFSVGFFLEKDF